MDTINILGIDVISLKCDRVLDLIIDVLNSDTKEAKYICATSVHGIIESQSDAQFRHILNNAFINHADGKSLFWASRLLGQKEMDHIKGPNLILKICEATSKMDVRHFFYGGKEGVAGELANNLSEKFPGLKVAGVYSPPFRPLNENEKKQIISMIHNSNTDIVWVGLSTPKQEKWIYEFAPQLRIKLLFSVGAAFDFHTGRQKVAPKWMEKLALEWFYRILLNPRVYFKRYAKAVPLFIFYFTLQYFGLKKFKNNE